MGVYEIRLPKTLAELLQACEKECVAGCCGLEAFDFTEATFRSWFVAHPQQKEAAKEQGRGLVGEIRARTEEEISSAELNAWWPRGGAVEFFSGLTDLMEGAS